MRTRPTAEQTELGRYAEWAQANYGIIAKIGDIAGDLKFHAKSVRDAIEDPTGERVMQVRRAHRRLVGTFAELEELPQPLHSAV